MAKGQLFEYVILHHPKQTKEQAERNEEPKSTLVKGPTHELAATKEEVSILASRAIPDEFLTKLETVEIVIRPF
jgi:hypothetical protein